MALHCLTRMQCHIVKSQSYLNNHKTMCILEEKVYLNIVVHFTTVTATFSLRNIALRFWNSAQPTIITNLVKTQE